MPEQLTAWLRESPKIRWAALGPGALAMGIVVLFPIHWVVILGTTFFRTAPESDDGGLSLWNIPPERLERFAYALFIPGVIVYTAGNIAPRHRFTASLGTAIVCGIGYAALLGYGIGAETLVLRNTLLDLVIPLVLNVVSVSYAVASARSFPEPATLRD